MAYAAVTCLFHTLHLLLTSSRTCLASSSQKLLKSARRSAKRLQRTLEEYDRNKNSGEGVMAVDARIRDEARRLEDLIESEASARFVEIMEHEHGRVHLNLHHLRHHIDCFVETAKKLRAEYMKELRKPQEAAAAAAVAGFESGGPGCAAVGLSGPACSIRDDIAEYDDSSDLQVFAITGMVGIGKTKLVKMVFDDLLGDEVFDCGAFVRVGQKYVYEDVLREIIAQINVDGQDQFFMEGDDEGLDEWFKTRLEGRKILLVLDDIWDNSLQHICTYLTLGSCVLVTSRICDTFDNINCFVNMSRLNADESWELLRKKVFGEDEHCPPQLVKAGKKIAENCEGLPLLILAVAQILSEAPKKPEYWKAVAKMKNSVFEDAMDQIYDVLLPSYHFLKQRSRACFLYLCAFPMKCILRHSRIANLLRAERFGDGVVSILDEIVSSNLVVIHETFWSSTGAKDFNLHVVFRHLTRKEGEHNKFLHILNTTYADGSTIASHMKDKRYLAIYHNTLLAIKEVHSSISSSSVSTLRSALCTGPYHQYQVPITSICLELKLLRVLDAVSIRFYKFPEEVVKLIQLRYLSLTTNANLPPSINKLWFLECLVVHQHLSIINRTSTSVADLSSYVPVEIWELQELEHLQIMGRNLPHPPPGAILPNLSKLLDVGVQTCSKGVLESLPKLEKLRIQFELAPDDEAAQSMSCIDHISCLKSFPSVVRNPKLFLNPSVPPRFHAISIASLSKLSLSGFGYPWEDMSKIAELPNLQVLKLQRYAFRGQKWEANAMRFLNLEYLLIEDSDVVQWTAAAGEETFPSLRHVILKNCYKLQEMPAFKTYKHLQLFDCNPLADTCAKLNVECYLQVNYSWM